jgi:hypothetical protein
MRPVLSLILLRKPKGPPAATYQGAGSGSNSTNTTTMTLTTGTAFPTRLVAIIIPSIGAVVAQTITSAVFDGTNNALSFGTLAGAGTSNVVMYVVGLVPTGTSSSLVITFSGSVSATFRFGCYTMDSSQMLSTTPTTFGSSALSSATSDTLNLTVPINGSVVIAADDGGNNVTKTFSGSPTMTSDINFNVTKIGHANGVSIGIQPLTINWTPASVAEAFGALVFR